MVYTLVLISIPLLFFIVLKDLIKITAIPNGSETGTEITELFNISLVYDDSEEFETKVEIVKDALGEIVGLKFKEGFPCDSNTAGSELCSMTEKYS